MSGRQTEARWAQTPLELRFSSVQEALCVGGASAQTRLGRRSRQLPEHPVAQRQTLCVRIEPEAGGRGQLVRPGLRVAAAGGQPEEQGGSGTVARGALQHQRPRKAVHGLQHRGRGHVRGQAHEGTHLDDDACPLQDGAVEARVPGQVEVDPGPAGAGEELGHGLVHVAAEGDVTGHIGHLDAKLAQHRLGRKARAGVAELEKVALGSEGLEVAQRPVVVLEVTVTGHGLEQIVIVISLSKLRQHKGALIKVRRHAFKANTTIHRKSVCRHHDRHVGGAVSWTE
mmetsp:Transcript_101734/g.291910  ORF Transcript_101734/g.291910 Transcript_101734/m.291910 type:complete len:284 (-) Transcript_101734:27-878(-)